MDCILCNPDNRLIFHEGKLLTCELSVCENCRMTCPHCSNIVDANEIVVCADCERVYCELCSIFAICRGGTQCIKTFCIGEGIKKCACGKYNRLDDIVECAECDKNVCIKCQLEANNKVYCEDCASRCSGCGGDTVAYRSTFTCNECGKILCERCLIDGICSECYRDSCSYSEGPETCDEDVFID